MYAIVDCRGQQVTVRPGEQVAVPYMEGEPGTKVTLDRVLLIGGEDTSVGTPHVEGATVAATIAEQTHDPKITVFAIFGAINWIARWFNPEGAMRSPALGDAFANHLVGGITCP